MAKTTASSRLFASSLFFLALCLSAFTGNVAHSSSADTDNSEAQTEARFLLGKITSNPSKQYRRIQPMADLLARELNYAEAGSMFSKDVKGMLDKMQSGDVDLFTGSAYEASVLIEAGVGDALALKAKEGKKVYQSIIVVRMDSAIDSIEQLGGKTIAFEDAGSTSAYRVPYLELTRAGFELLETHRKPGNKNRIHYRFSGTEQNSSALLYKGLVDAIALSDDDWRKSDNVPGFQRSQFRIIYTSQPIPRALEVVRSSLDEKTKNRLQQILLNLHQDKNAKSVMDLYHNTTEFSPVTPETRQYLRELGEYFSE